MKRILLFAAACLVFACTAPVQPEQKPDDKQDEQNPGDDTTPGNDTTPGDDTNPGGGDDKFAPEAWYETNYWERSDRERAGFRGPVKKWYLSGSKAHREFEYNEAGNLTIIRDVDPDSPRGEWMEQYEYDDNGRLIKKTYGRSTQKGGMEFDNWASLYTWTYEYNNPGKYVWVRPDDSPFSSFYAFRHLSPESFCEHDVEMYGNAIIMKDLSAIQIVNCNSINNIWPVTDVTYQFNGDGNLVYSTNNYHIDPESGERVPNDQDWELAYDPIIYSGNYPSSGAIGSDGRIFYEITSMTWQDNGMPLRLEGPDGITEFYTDQKRYICTKRWDCQPGKPHDSLFVFGYWETYKYNEAGDLVEMQERFNEDSDEPWTRPTTWEFEYDSHGNWTSYKTKYMIAVGGPNGEVEDGSLSRTIEYY